MTYIEFIDLIKTLAIFEVMILVAFIAVILSSRGGQRMK